MRITLLLTLLTLTLTPVLAQGTLLAPHAPKYVGSVSPPAGDSFVPTTVDFGSTESVVFGTTHGLLSFARGSQSKHSYTAYPSSVSSPVAALLSTTAGGVLLLSPSPTSVQLYSCNDPSNPYGASCSLSPVGSPVSLPVPSSTSWAAITYAYNPTSGGRYVFLLSDDLLMVVLSCSGASCSFSSKMTIDSVFPKASVFSHIQTFTGGEEASTSGMGDLWLVLGGSPKGSTAEDPGVILHFDVDDLSSTPGITYTSGAPDVSVVFGSSPSVLALSVYQGSNTTLLAFDVDNGKDYARVSFVSGAPAVSGCGTPAATGSSRSLFVVSNTAGQPGTSILFADLSNGGGVVSLGAVSGNTPVTSASCRSAKATVSQVDTVWVPTLDANSNAAVLIYDYAGASTSGSTGSTGYSGGGGSTGYSGGGGSTGYSGAAGGASSGSSSSSSGSAKPIALKAAPKVKDVTPCVDPDQAPTCVKACEPIPAIICGPGRPAPDTVDGSPATCYILPTGPEACNYCPASFSRFCP